MDAPDGLRNSTSERALRDDEVAEISDRLRQQHAELAARLEAIRKDVGKKLNADSREQAVELENAPVLDELAREAEDELSKVNDALARLTTGSYGICAQCRLAIAPARLFAYPAAIRCIGCESEQG